MTWKEFIENMERIFGFNINSKEEFSLFEMEAYIEKIYGENNND